MNIDWIIGCNFEPNTANFGAVGHPKRWQVHGMCPPKALQTRAGCAKLEHIPIFHMTSTTKTNWKIASSIVTILAISMGIPSSIMILALG